MAIDFPASPANGTIYTDPTSGNRYVYISDYTYWKFESAVTYITAVNTGVGLSGGPITTNGTISALANTGIVANSTGLFVNATYIGTISANNASFLGGTAAASYQLNSTLNANIASYLPTYTGVVNGSSHTVGSSTIANATGVYTTGTVNGATISTGTVNVLNASGLTTTANVSIGAAGDLILTAGAGLSANGSLGSAAQLLTSNGSSVYWSSAGVNTAAQYAWTNTHTYTANVTFGNTTVYPFVISYFGYSNPNTFTVGSLTTSASLNTMLVGPYTIATGNTLTIATGSRVVII